MPDSLRCGLVSGVTGDGLLLYLYIYIRIYIRICFLVSYISFYTRHTCHTCHLLLIFNLNNIKGRNNSRIKRYVLFWLMTGLGDRLLTRHQQPLAGRRWQ